MARVEETRRRFIVHYHRRGFEVFGLDLCLPTRFTKKPIDHTIIVYKSACSRYARVIGVSSSGSRTIHSGRPEGEDKDDCNTI